jgi:hypothetical protein
MILECVLDRLGDTERLDLTQDRGQWVGDVNAILNLRVA